jgi:hypothetical protein
MNIFIVISFLFYIIYTLLFSIKFNKKNIYYNGRQKIVHNILIWIIPFLWITFLKVIMKPTLGSENYEKKTIQNNSGIEFYDGV